VQVHMLGQHHVNTLAEALEELRVYGHARRGARPATGTRADFGSSLSTPMDLDSHQTSRNRLNNVQSFRSSRPTSRGPPRHLNSSFAPRRSVTPPAAPAQPQRSFSGNRDQNRSFTPRGRPYCQRCRTNTHYTARCWYSNPPSTPQPGATHGRGNPYGRGAPQGNGRGGRAW
jgi:hypothetical protein